MYVLTFSTCHPGACQGTATPTACWESWWVRVRGRWRRRRKESSASGREKRSWRNAPAPRRCYLPSVSRWLRSNRRLSTQCGTNTLCCEYSRLTFLRVLDMVICETCRIHSFISFTPTTKAVSYVTSAAHCHLCGRITRGLRCLLSLFTHGDDNSINDFPVFSQWNRWCPQWPSTSWHMVRLVVFSVNIECVILSFPLLKALLRAESQLQ